MPNRGTSFSASSLPRGSSSRSMVLHMSSNVEWRSTTLEGTVKLQSEVVFFPLGVHRLWIMPCLLSCYKVGTASLGQGAVFERIQQPPQRPCSANTARRRLGISTSGCPGSVRTFLSILHLLPSAARTNTQSLVSGVVPVLLMRDMISLRFSGVKMSAISPRARLVAPFPPPAGVRHREIRDRHEYTSGTFPCTPGYIADDGLCQHRPRTS